MSYFNDVTGTSEYERQSWRDSYNGGRAAGDWTGNTNARLDAERRAFGATWGGSSTQPSALERARSYHERPMAGPGGGHVATGPVMAGPGAPARRPSGGSRLRLFPDEKWTVPVNVPGPGGGDFVVAIPRADPETLLPQDKPLKRIGVGGQQESLGAISDIGWARTATGWVPVPSSDIKERIEDNFFMETSWFLRNYVAPMFWSGQEKAPDFLDPEYSHYAPLANEWREGNRGRPNKDGVMVWTGGGF